MSQQFPETETVAGSDSSACCVSVGSVTSQQTNVGVAELAARFKALADPNRLKILGIVQAANGGEVCVCDLPGPLGLTQPTVSHHLKVLVEAGLLRREKRGVWAYFSPVAGALDGLATALHSGLRTSVTLQSEAAA